ncbi:chemotaxis protein CheW [Sphingomonas mollis]|uniref:Chemotaxis protein CheW n=1 Tax=Sphingomonas mollis TaxID=2795726 RepID=A0ABS0XRE3_9SPHN|nr:chemotaxis protein CheW [Sphingomonas sp. BT553]MBJ6122355.1 chemotaxis protein CheW [Sphingomonas sp. BT553]
MTHPSSPSSIAWNADGELQALTFVMGTETFAIEAEFVHEILDLLPTTVVPGADPLVGHLINFRGRVIPLADLKPAFAMEAATDTSPSRIIVVELSIGDGNHYVGLRADAVDEVATIHVDTVEPPPQIGMRWPRDHVRGLVRRGDGIVVIPDIAILFERLATRAGRSVH